MFDYGNDIGTALELLEPMSTLAWKPRMQVSIATTEEDRAAENRQYEIEFKADCDTYSKGYRPTKIIIPRHMRCSGKDATKP